jgi:hypothetical protein
LMHCILYAEINKDSLLGDRLLLLGRSSFVHDDTCSLEKF